jgi:plastocyanin
MRHRLFLSATVTLMIAAGCAGGSPGSGTPPPGAVVVTAANLAFVPASITAPAQRGFALLFDNRDSVLHNVKLVDSTGQAMVTGEVFTGPSARTVDVPALPAGTYKLLCDVHPDMAAELIAGP